MRKPSLIETRDVALLDIHIEARLREVDEATVAALMTSIEQSGLQYPINLRRVRVRTSGKKTEYQLKLMAGAHRLAAFHELGHEAIPARIWDCTDDYAQLMEIDDNLARGELTPLDRAIFLCRRKEVYERMYPETKAAKGVELAAKRWDAADNLSVASFVSATALQTGQSERNIRRTIGAAEGLSDSEIGLLRSAPKLVTISDLQVIAKCEPKKRPGIVSMLAKGEAGSAAEALASMVARPGDAVVDPIDAKVRPLSDGFARAPKAARYRFVRDNIDVIRAILEELEGE